MDVLEVIQTRRSVRIFDSRDVADHVIERILKAMSSAPSAGNLQAYKVAVVRDRDQKAGLVSAAYD